MATGYGYAPTGGQDTVDYAGIGARAGEDIFNELDKREARRTAIDTQEQKDFSHLKNDIPQGDDQSHNTFLLNFGSDSSTALLQLNKELKSGKISPRDFTIRRQNMMDASDHILNMGDHYNKVFKEKMDLYNTGKIGEEDRQNMADIGKMTDFTKTKTRYNANGTVSIIGGDGNEVSTTQIYGMLGGNIPKYDMEGETGKLSKSFAPYIEVLKKNGIKTLSSTKNAPGYQEKMNGLVGSLLVNPHTAGSILADNSGGIDGKKYYFTKDPSDKNPLAILKVLDPENKSSGLYVPQLSDKQMKAAKELVQGSIEKGFKYEEIAMPTYKATKETGADKKIGAESESVKQIRNIFFGSPAEAKNGTTFVKGLKGRPTLTVNDADKAIFTIFGKEEVTIPKKDDQGNPIPEDELVKSAASAIGGITNQESIKRANISGNSKLNDYAVEQKQKSFEKVSWMSPDNKTVLNGVDEINKGLENEKAAPVIDKIFEKLPDWKKQGLQIDAITHGWGKDDIKFTSPLFKDPIVILKAKNNPQKVINLVKKIYNLKKGQMLDKNSDEVDASAQTEGETPAKTESKSNLGKWGQYAR